MREHLSQPEIDALLDGAGKTSSSSDGLPGEVRLFDFSALERVVRGRWPALELVNERFRGHLSEGIGPLIMRRAEISEAALKVRTYSAFVQELPVPSHCSVMAIRPLGGRAVVVCEPTLIFAIIDAMYGGAGQLQPPPDAREYSAAERRAIGHAVSAIALAWNQAWRGIHPLQMALERTESKPQFANIAALGARVVTTSFQLEIGEITGALHVCMPYASLEPIREILRSGNSGDFADGNPRWVNLLSHEIPAIDVMLDARFAPLDTTVARLLAMKVGDFIGMDRERPLDALINDVPLFECNYGTRNAKYAIQIVKSLTGSVGRKTSAPNE